MIGRLDANVVFDGRLYESMLWRSIPLNNQTMQINVSFLGNCDWQVWRVLNRLTVHHALNWCQCSLDSEFSAGFGYLLPSYFMLEHCNLYTFSSRRERHAKTLDIAQEEVLTCLGSYLYVRFNRLLQKIRLEEQTWQQLSYIGICCLRQNFEVCMY